MNTKRSAVKTTTRRRRSPAPAFLPLPSGRRVLMIDDDAEYLELLRRFLAAFDVEVHVCGAPELALAMARSRRPDVIVTDFMMPGRNGFELVEELRCDEELQSIPRVLMTGTPRAAALRDLARYDVHDVLSKPISKQGLIDALQRALGGLLPQKVDWTNVVKDEPIKWLD